MSKYTEHLGLVQPAGNEYYDIEQFNHNAELIDKETKKLSEGLAKVQEGATRDKAGIVQFGTGEGKALEGMMLARLAGCVGYGGDIQDEGVKDINYLYYDKNTRKMYKCINSNNDTSANVNNFKPLDNNSLSDKINSLSYFKFEVVTITSNKNTTGGFGLIACGNLRMIYFSNIIIKNDYETTFRLPDWFCQGLKGVTGSCVNGSGGQGGGTAEMGIDVTNKLLKFYPTTVSGFTTLEFTGQIITVAV
ncbi:ribose-phosphate pyrophosphokinase [Fusobacterium nucleatum]|uniref:ribose-phosphate pyrophosphokinase n=1 Tax=Fusobacterium nucleatum TaxID=851 RepID=UPI00201B0A8A|nr:ribose-phosphate pyrophosphokinase [Fusobacterium nucleatum]MCL4584223.1 ribose-phosphate pyrophosphokinase [Fusobacterium nucleatum YWH7055]DAN17408.1 MAG TPA: hypothetical protein [Caudoviricetes sp.]